jgi:hypothetical protein
MCEYIFRINIFHCLLWQHEFTTIFDMPLYLPNGIGTTKLVDFLFYSGIQTQGMFLSSNKKEGTWQHWDKTKMNSQVRV